MIKNFEPRLYQETILNTAAEKNTLVVLPTGMGKTNIFLMLSAQRLKQFPNSKILFIGPTKPLIDQYMAVFKEHFEIDENKMSVFTGMISPEKRGELWKKSKIIFSTPQGLENDIISNRINLAEVCLLGVDEAHRAVGDYAYVFVAKQFMKLSNFPRIIALTASPGSDMEKIQEVCKNLFIEDIEVRTDEDPDVKPYVQEIHTEWVNVELPRVFIDIQKFLLLFLRERFERLKKSGVLKKADVKFVSKSDLLQLQGEIRSRISQGDKDFAMWSAISTLAEVMKIYHALELLETQGINALHKYFEKLVSESSTSQTKAIRSIMADSNFKSALIKARILHEEGVEHPKLIELQNIVDAEAGKNPNIKIMIFNQYRDNALDVMQKLNKLSNVKANIFVGQQKKIDTGMSQKEQKQMLDDFRNGLFNVLVATSIGEEGLDIPKVDLVIFYEPIPSAIRSIQRRGRTGRQEKGRVIILLAKGTRDESYRWVAHHKEKKMYMNLISLRKKLNLTLHERKENSAAKHTEDKIKIFADYREKGSGVIKEMVEENIQVNLERLEYADYILSSRCGVEIKTVSDFVDSIIDGRLLEQIKNMKNNFERPVIVIEGSEDIYSVRNVHHNSILGMMATIAVSYGIPIIQTKNFKETASLLQIIARREQAETSKDFNVHADRKPTSLKEQQEYFISSLPGINLTLSKPLLKHFKTIKNIVNASAEELQKVEKIGPAKAKQIKEVVESEYNGD
ncbi:MAG TPA: DEAD/DEAH box helicase [Candidatus Nanoarchaeia archaeon]|nr:DEAD/DEAH box helicase [Candidatus Nanoarchaeia archaeon]